MAKRKSPIPADLPARFPYSDLWEEIGDQWVTFELLSRRMDEFEAQSELADLLGLDLPNPGLSEFEALVSTLTLSPENSARMIEDSRLIAGWHLAPQRRRMLRTDVASVRKRLGRIARLSAELYLLANRVTPRVDEIIKVVMRNEPSVFSPDGPSLYDLRKPLHDLAAVTERMVRDTAPSQKGRSKEFVRDTTIRLALEAARRAGLDDLTISRGTSDNPEPHFDGRAGEYLRGLLALVIPGQTEASLVPVIERVRRKAANHS